MKANHVPATVRLKNRIDNLAIREEGAWARRRGNPYAYCRSCGISIPEFSVRSYTHHKGCEYSGILKEIAHYKQLLEACKQNLAP